MTGRVFKAKKPKNLLKLVKNQNSHNHHQHWESHQGSIAGHSSALRGRRGNLVIASLSHRASSYDVSLFVYTECLTKLLTLVFF